MVEPAELLALSQPKRTSPWVTCGVLAAGGMVIFVLLIVLLYLREDREEQAAREDAIEAIQKTKEINLADRAKTFTATLTGDDARLLGELARQLMRESPQVSGSVPGGWGGPYEDMTLELKDESGVTSEIRFDHRQAYYLPQADEWYGGQEEFTLLLKLIYILQALGAGVDKEKLNIRVEYFGGWFSYLAEHAGKYRPFPWANSTPEQRAFVDACLAEFNSISGQPPLQWPKEQ